MIDILTLERDLSPAGVAAGDRSCDSFDDLLAQVRTRLGVLLGALGTSATDEQIEQAVLDVTLEVARFTLEWVEGDAGQDEPELPALRCSSFPQDVVRTLWRT